MSSGAIFPPIDIYHDGEKYCWLMVSIDSALRANLTTVNAVVHQGADETLYPLGRANAAHGLRRTNADKRRAVETLLRMKNGLTGVIVLEACKVDHKTVAKIRTDLEFPVRGTANRLSVIGIGKKPKRST